MRFLIDMVHKLKKYTVLVVKDINSGDGWDSVQYSRARLINRKIKPFRNAYGSLSQQIDGMDFPTKSGIKKHVALLLARNKIKASNVNMVVS
jgi:hypothetical protein